MKKQVDMASRSVSRAGRMVMFCGILGEEGRVVPERTVEAGWLTVVLVEGFMLVVVAFVLDLRLWKKMLLS